MGRNLVPGTQRRTKPKRLREVQGPGHGAPDETWEQRGRQKSRDDDGGMRRWRRRGQSFVVLLSPPPSLVQRVGVAAEAREERHVVFAKLPRDLESVAEMCFFFGFISRFGGESLCRREGRGRGRNDDDVKLKIEKKKKLTRLPASGSCPRFLLRSRVDSPGIARACRGVCRADQLESERLATRTLLFLFFCMAQSVHCKKKTRKK